MSGPADDRGPDEGGRHVNDHEGGRPDAAGHDGSRSDTGGDDDAFVAFLREAASDYHRPPPTPRDALWEGVRAGLSARDTGRLGREAGPTGRSRLAGPEDGSASADDAATADALEEARSTYHRPPETPADEMWPAVEAAWRRRDVTPIRPPEDDGEGRPDDARRGPGASSMPAWVRVAGVAAVLAVGVLVGRASIDDAGPPQTSVAVEDTDGPVDGEGPGPAATGGEASVAGAPAGGEDAAAPDAGGDGPDAEARPTDGALPAGGGDGRLERADAGRLAAAEEGGGGRSEARRRAATFRAAAYAHLGRSELFLAGFRMDSLDAEPTARRARDLLSETRLYLDWARDDSPHLSALLEDLELVLAQIARLDESTWARERALVLDGMERRGVLSLLQSAVPAGPPWPDRASPSGT